MKSDCMYKDVPRALSEVWDWKNSVCQEVGHLPTPEALHAIMDLAEQAARSAGMVEHAESPAKRLRVAETSGTYS